MRGVGIPNHFINSIICRDCVQGMRDLPSNTIPLTVTSPPYDGMRKYGGHLFEFDKIAPELFRITQPGGTVAWVVADQIRDGSESGTSARQKLTFLKLGFRVHQTLTIVSEGFKPQSRRYPRQTQSCFILCKGAPTTVNLLRDRRNRNLGRKVIGTFGVRTDVWHYAVGFGQTTQDRDAFEHPALMPEKLAQDLILSWSQPGDLVFDPMAGAATTLKMAMLCDRMFLGFEIHEPYLRLAIERLKMARTEHC